jgi:hypothetical protein
MRAFHLKVVKERLGDADILVTLEPYFHVLPDIREEAGEWVGNLF